MGFHTWINNRAHDDKHLSTKILKKKKIRDSFCFLELYDTVWLLMYVIYIILFLVLPCREIVKHQLPVASSMIVLLEQVG
jgi:hypothetical protein